MDAMVVDAPGEGVSDGMPVTSSIGKAKSNQGKSSTSLLLLRL